MWLSLNTISTSLPKNVVKISFLVCCISLCRRMAVGYKHLSAKLYAYQHVDRISMINLKSSMKHVVFISKVCLMQFLLYTLNLWTIYSLALLQLLS